MLIPILATLALAQDFTDGANPPVNAQLYRPPVDAQMTLWTSDTHVEPGGTFSGRVVFDYVHRPLKYTFLEGPRAGEEIQLVDHAVQAHVVPWGTVGPLRLGLDVPVYLATNGDGIDGGAGFGDLSLDTKLGLLDRETSPVGLAVGGRVQLPTNGVDAAVGYERTAWEVQGIVDGRVGNVLLAANLGTRGVPEVSLENVEVDDQFFFRTGAGWAASPLGGLSLDLMGAIDYADAENFPLEGMLGGYWRVHEELTVRGGVGTGLTDAVGSSAFRSVLMLSRERMPGPGDIDLDTIVDTEDQCPTDPEDFDTWLDLDGCPDPDNDADGLADVEDSCPLDPEDPDDWEDEDGCPDPTARVAIRLVDPDGRTVGVAASLDGIGVGDVIGGYTEIDLHPGTYDIFGRADGFEPFAMQFEVPEAAPLEVVETLTPIVALGTVRVQVVDPAFEPIAAEWAIGEDAFVEVDGQAELVRSPGEYPVIVRAPGYPDALAEVEVVADEVSELTVVLKPPRVQVTRERLEIGDKVYFETNEAVIKAESYELLDEVAQTILDHPEIVRVQIEGHTDSRGSDAYNLELSERRAAAVREYLVDYGIAPSRLDSRGFGEERPVDEREVAEAWDRNRRVDFMVVREEDVATAPSSESSH